MLVSCFPRYGGTRKCKQHNPIFQQFGPNMPDFIRRRIVTFCLFLLVFSMVVDWWPFVLVVDKINIYINEHSKTNQNNTI